MQVLETPRLRLRWFTPDDAPFALELLNDPAWLQNIGNRHLRSIEDAREKIVHEWIPFYWRHGFGSWVVELKSTRTAMGICGLFRRESLPDIDLGYALLPSYYKQGYASEASKACLDYAGDVLGLSRVLAFTAPGNIPSQRLLERIGMRFEAQRPVRLQNEDSESRIYGWSNPKSEAQLNDPPNDQSAIDDLVRRFFSLFNTQNGNMCRLTALPFFCVPEVRFIKVQGLEREVSDLPNFVLPRIEWLHHGNIRNFSEFEIEATAKSPETRVSGSIAQRWIHYQKAWTSDAQKFSGTGHKSMQFIRTPEGWKIATLLWWDDPAMTVQI